VGLVCYPEVSNILYSLPVKGQREEGGKEGGREGGRKEERREGGRIEERREGGRECEGRMAKFCHCAKNIHVFIMQAM